MIFVVALLIFSWKPLRRTKEEERKGFSHLRMREVKRKGTGKPL